MLICTCRLFESCWLLVPIKALSCLDLIYRHKVQVGSAVGAAIGSSAAGAAGSAGASASAGGSASGGSGGGATVLISQIQFLNMYGKIGGSNGSKGLRTFTDGFGLFVCMCTVFVYSCCCVWRALLFDLIMKFIISHNVVVLCMYFIQLHVNTGWANFELGLVSGPGDRRLPLLIQR